MSAPPSNFEAAFDSVPAEVVGWESPLARASKSDDCWHRTLAIGSVGVDLEAITDARVAGPVQLVGFTDGIYVSLRRTEVMTSTVKEIINQLERRRQRLRSWVTQGSHPLVIDQVRDAHAALGAMAGILGEMAPAMSRLLVDAIDNEQRMQSLREEQKVRDKERARQLRADAETEEDKVHAEFLKTTAQTYEHSVDVPDMSDVRVAGVLLTASKLYRAAEQVSRARDAEAIKTLGLKSVSTAAKWALKLTPIRQEDLQDLKEAWEGLKAITGPLDDATAILEAGKMRTGQVKAASSLFERLQVVRELAEEWSRTALNSPFLAEAIKVESADAALRNRFDRSKAEWT